VKRSTIFPPDAARYLRGRRAQQEYLAFPQSSCIDSGARAVSSPQVTMRNKEPRRHKGKKKPPTARNMASDEPAHGFVEAGHPLPDVTPRNPVEARAEAQLRENESTRQFFGHLATEEDSRQFVHLLCCAVVLRAQPGKIDPLMNDLMRATVDNLRNVPARIETFCAWLRPLIFDFRVWLTPLVPTNHAVKKAMERCEAVFPVLSETGEYIKAGVDVGRLNIAQWDSGLTETLRALVRYVKSRAGTTPRYAELAKLLSETASALGLRQTYSAEFIRMRVRKHSSKP